jgi:hypothetical protein
MPSFTIETIHLDGAPRPPFPGPPAPLIRPTGLLGDFLSSPLRKNIAVLFKPAHRREFQKYQTRNRISRGSSSREDVLEIRHAAAGAPEP